MMLARLPSCTAHDVDRVLTRQGFIVTHQKGSHRYYKSPITGKIVAKILSGENAGMDLTLLRPDRFN